MENEESISVLAERCQRIGYIIKTAAEGQKLEDDERMVKAIEGLARCGSSILSRYALADRPASTVKDTAEIMKKKLARSRGRKLLHVFDDADEIEMLDSTLTQFIAEFQVTFLCCVLAFTLKFDIHLASSYDHCRHERERDFAMGQGQFFVLRFSLPS